MPEPTIDQLMARERAEAWLAAGSRHAERGEDLLALGCFVIAEREAPRSDMATDELRLFLVGSVEKAKQQIRRLSGTMPEEGATK